MTKRVLDITPKKLEWDGDKNTPYHDSTNIAKLKSMRHRQRHALDQEPDEEYESTTYTYLSQRKLGLNCSAAYTYVYTHFDLEDYDNESEGEEEAPKQTYAKTHMEWKSGSSVSKDSKNLLALIRTLIKKISSMKDEEKTGKRRYNLVCDVDEMIAYFDLRQKGLNSRDAFMSLFKLYNITIEDSEYFAIQHPHQDSSTESCFSSEGDE